jgi:hypothetical protein
MEGPPRGRALRFLPKKSYFLQTLSCLKKSYRTLGRTRCSIDGDHVEKNCGPPYEKDENSKPNFAKNADPEAFFNSGRFCCVGNTFQRGCLLVLPALWVITLAFSMTCGFNLTMLLKEAFTGNSKTWVVGTLSPSATCLFETLGTKIK